MLGRNGRRDRKVVPDEKRDGLDEDRLVALEEIQLVREALEPARDHGFPLPTCHPVPRRAAIAGVEDEGGGLSREEGVTEEELREPRPKELEALVSLDPDFDETGEIFEPEPALARAARLAPLDPDDGLPL